jgi:hypothetical protein
MTEKLRERNGFVYQRAEGPEARGRRALGSREASDYNDDMMLLGLLLSLAAPSGAQAGPAPCAQVEPGAVDELFKRFNSGRPMIPTLKEVQAEQLKRDLAPRPEARGSDEGPSGGFAQRNRPPLTDTRRQSDESVNVAVSRPFPRVELGAGYSETNVYEGRRHLQDASRKYAFLSIDLSRLPPPRKLLHLPTAVHEESEVGENIRVEKDEYTARFLKHPAGE